MCANSPSRSKILVVEDEPELARLVELHLRDAGWETVVAADARSARQELEGGGWDLVVLDLMLPDGDGLDLCRLLRGRADYTPILILTARSSELDRVVGLEVGADDYLTKPFSVRELVARVKAILRRVELAGRVAMEEGESRLEIGALSIDQEKRRVAVEGRPVRLTAKEFDLLVHFARHPGRVYSRAQLLDSVWGYVAGSYEHTVNSHINRLRSKIERDPSNPHYVQTVWGVGYRFFDPAAPEEET